MVVATKVLPQKAGFLQIVSDFCTHRDFERI